MSEMNEKMIFYFIQILLKNNDISAEHIEETKNILRDYELFYLEDMGDIDSYFSELEYFLTEINDAGYPVTYSICLLMDLIAELKPVQVINSFKGYEFLRIEYSMNTYILTADKEIILFDSRKDMTNWIVENILLETSINEVMELEQIAGDLIK